MSAIVLCVVAAVGDGNTASPVAPSAGCFTRIDAVVRAHVERDRIPGLSVAIIADNEKVWSKGYGIADLEHQVAATSDTIYRFASITRMITATAVLQLVQRGKLDLKARVRDYVPEYEQAGAMTVEHLLANLAGIRTLNSASEFHNRKRYRRLVDTIAAFSEDAPVAKPGRLFYVSPFGYNLLGLIVERVSGESYEDYLKEEIFSPAGMTTAAIDRPERVTPDRARGYVMLKDGSLRNSLFVDLSFLAPAEGLMGSINDLASFAAAFLDDRLLSAPYRKLMTTPYKTATGKATHYGLGCFVGMRNGRKIVGHAGWQPQVNTFLLIYPAENMAVAVIANLEQAPVDAIAHEVADALLKDLSRGD